MRVPFSEIFQVNPNGSISPKTKIIIGGVTMAPGVSFTKGVSFSGVDIASHAGHDLEIERQENAVIIKAIYKSTD